MLYVMLTILLIVIDQVVKFLVRANIPLGNSVPFLPHVLELTYVQNTGAAFSLLAAYVTGIALMWKSPGRRRLMLFTAALGVGAVVVGYLLL